MVNKMSVSRIRRNGESFSIKDLGTKGFEIETKDLCCDSDYAACPFVRFKSFEDYLKYFYVDSLLDFLYSVKCYFNSNIRNNERMFYNNLKEIEKSVDQFEPIEEEYLGYTVISDFFKGICYFMREYKLGIKLGIKHGNKKIEKKFHKIAKKIEELIGLPSTWPD